MLSFLKGNIESKHEGVIDIDVSGVGYEILVSNETLNNSGNVGDFVKLFVFLCVRENEVFLIGFKTIEEKNLFLNLITVSGVGPKTALQILSGNSCASIISAVIKGDSGLISSAKGVGKKTAERIVLELKEKFIKEHGNLTVAEKMPVSLDNNSVMSDAILALVSLGLSKQEAENAVRSEYKNGMVLEELISKSLRRI